MEAFPGVIRGTLSEQIDILKKNPSVAAIGFFGSWVRGETTPASDFDFLIVDNKGIDYEYSEAIVQGELVLDLHRVPFEWVHEPLSPVMDHRLNETIIIHDPKRILRGAKRFLLRSYMSPRRIETRTDGILATSEMHLSRASAAYDRGDPETASAYVGAGLVSASVVLLDIAGLPISRKSFVWDLRRACVKMEMEDVYREFLSLSGISNFGSKDVAESLDGLVTVWDEVSSYVNQKREILRGLHGKIRRDLEYYSSSPILEGVTARTQEMLELNNFPEAIIFLQGWMLPLLENYAWVISAVAGEKYDYTSLFRVVGESLRDEASRVLGLYTVTERSVGDSLEAVRNYVRNIRLDRRRLIDSYVK
jgi:hypothetical protein